MPSEDHGTETDEDVAANPGTPLDLSEEDEAPTPPAAAAKPAAKPAPKVVTHTRQGTQATTPEAIRRRATQSTPGRSPRHNVSSKKPKR